MGKWVSISQISQLPNCDQYCCNYFTRLTLQLSLEAFVDLTMERTPWWINLKDDELPIWEGKPVGCKAGETSRGLLLALVATDSSRSIFKIYSTNARFIIF